MGKALFLDRDGVINKDINYLYLPDDFEFIDGVFDLCHAFLAAGYQIFVITNQAGIARGLYTEKDFAELTEWMLDQFLQRGISITKVYFCPYHATAGIGKYKQDSQDRKPNPGMLLQARDQFGVALASSVLVGDKESDIEAGINAGVGTTIIFAPEKKPCDTRADFTTSELSQIANLLKNQKVR